MEILGSWMFLYLDIIIDYDGKVKTSILIPVILFGIAISIVLSLVFPSKRWQILFVVPVFSPMFLILPLLILIFILSIILTLSWLLAPEQLWATLPSLALIWIVCYRDGRPLAKAVKKTIQPWLIGMLLVAIVFLLPRAFLSVSNWGWLFIIEEYSGWVDVTLERLIPNSVYFNILLFLCLLGIDVILPKMRSVTRRFGVILSTARSVAVVLAVFTSFSFFSPAQAGSLVKATAREKFDRLHEQSVTRAELILTARLTDGKPREVNDVNAYLNAIYIGVIVEQSVEPYDDFGNYLRAQDLHKSYDRAASRRVWLTTLVNARVDELRKAARNHPSVDRVVDRLSDLNPLLLLTRKMTDQEVTDARVAFQKALDKFASDIADAGAHPLFGILKSAGATEIIQEIVKSIYKSEAERLAERISGPLANALFKSAKPLAQSPSPDLVATLQRPVFDPAPLPVDIVRPTVASRQEEKAAEKILRDIVAKAVEKAR